VQRGACGKYRKSLPSYVKKVEEKFLGKQEVDIII
jgi:hypothetical protein